MEIRTTHKMRQDLRQVDMVPHRVPFMEAARATDRVQVTEVPGATDRVQVTEVQAVFQEQLMITCGKNIKFGGMA